MDELTSEKTASDRKRRHTVWHNLDILSTVAFIGAGAFGLVGALNNIRHAFWETFVQGFGHIDTPFAALRDKYEARFQQIPREYEAGRITSKQYREMMRGMRMITAMKCMKNWSVSLALPPKVSRAGRLEITSGCVS